MAAAWVKGSRRVVGRNQNRVRGHLKHDIYPEFMGRHCELHVILECNRHKIEMSGGTLYVVGIRRNRQRNIMANTKPCKYCTEMIAKHTSIRSIVYISDDVIVKEFL